MSDSHSHAVQHHGPDSVKPYFAVFGLLCAFTAVSFVVNSLVRGGSMTAETGFGLILGVAVLKALLVCIIFMHLKWDWSKLYFLIVPALILAPFLMFALYPDVVNYWLRLATPFVR